MWKYKKQGLILITCY